MGAASLYLCNESGLEDYIEDYYLRRDVQMLRCGTQDRIDVREEISPPKK
jgi:hypothetical protein